jgi:hypothetical protein
MQMRRVVILSDIDAGLMLGIALMFSSLVDGLECKTAV